MQAWKVPEGMMMTPTNVIRYLSCKKFARIPKVPIGTRNFISHLLLLLDVDGHMVNCAPAAWGKRFLNSAAPRLPHGGNEEHVRADRATGGGEEDDRALATWAGVRRNVAVRGRGRGRGQTRWTAFDQRSREGRGSYRAAPVGLLRLEKLGLREVEISVEFVVRGVIRYFRFTHLITPGPYNSGARSSAVRVRPVKSGKRERRGGRSPEATSEPSGVRKKKEKKKKSIVSFNGRSILLQIETALRGFARRC
ncbi:hypothetical protein AXG93_2590s1050 [Marchantia polymorpha subsp. ruderalis]|uniref:Uncharacterized protein n=1 Tax=Marchantia polymorpha subsp. ruderalis TaxID=1480154 RepID=A0A176VSP0_MARPO|nr:hypothetical protein AXG93_2590s1050 [Marchantia polymorpha subsp. ruderalis]